MENQKRVKRGTTYPIILKIPGVDLTDAQWLIVTLKPQALSNLPTGSKMIELNREDLSVDYQEETSIIAFELTQEQSLSLDSKTAEIDVNWMKNNIRGGVIPIEITIGKTLLTREVYA